MMAFMRWSMASTRRPGLDGAADFLERTGYSIVRSAIPLEESAMPPQKIEIIVFIVIIIE